MTAGQKWIVDVIDRQSKKSVHSVEVEGSRQRVDKVQRGMNINLDLDKYYTRTWKVAAQ